MGKVEPTSRALGTLADDLHQGKLGMPEIQRDFVWSRPQICAFLESLYRGYPFGTMLFWKTNDDVPVKDSSSLSNDSAPSEFVLDGQQRITAIQRIKYDASVDIRFNIDSERFEAHRKAMDADASWISVRELWKTDTLSFANKHGLTSRPDTETISPRLSRMYDIQERMVLIQIVKDFDYDDVTEIFIRVNSEGTRLAGVDLAMALIALRLPATFNRELNDFAQSLHDDGWAIDKGTIIRCLMAVAMGESRFKNLQNRLTSDTDVVALKDAWIATQSAVHTFLTWMNSELGVESWSWVRSNNALVVPVTYIAKTNKPDRDLRATLRWFLLSLAWQRYSQGAEGRMKTDLDDLDKEDPFAALEQSLERQVRRPLRVTAGDLEGGQRARFLLHAYVAIRRQGAKDWFENVRLSTSNLGKQRTLEEHHIFPQSLVKGDYPREIVDELANIAFLSKEANLAISADSPRDYLMTVQLARLDQQFVPTNQALWGLSAFEEFLAARRSLLADGINSVIDDLS